MFNYNPPGVPVAGLPVGSPFGAPVVQPQLPPSTPTQPENDLIRGMNYLADYSGCGHWRMIWPEQILNAHQKAVIHSTTMMALDERYYNVTLI